jgi:hypothetical protein
MSLAALTESRREAGRCAAAGVGWTLTKLPTSEREELDDRRIVATNHKRNPVVGHSSR